MSILNAIILQEATVKINQPFRNSKYLKNCNLKIDSSVIQEQPDLANDKKFLTQLDKIYNTKIHKVLLDDIKKTYSEWNDNSISLNEMYSIAMKLLDTVSIDYISTKNKPNIGVSFWINSQYNNSLSDKFFGGHAMSCDIVIDAFTYKVLHIEEPSLIG